MAFRDRRIDDVRPNFFEGRERPLFVATHETTVADYVRCEDRRESALHGIHRLVKTLGKCSRMSGPFESTVKSRTEAIEECRWIEVASLYGEDRAGHGITDPDLASGDDARIEVEATGLEEDDDARSQVECHELVACVE